MGSLAEVRQMGLNLALHRSAINLGKGASQVDSSIASLSTSPSSLAGAASQPLILPISPSLGNTITKGRIVGSHSQGVLNGISSGAT